MAEWENVAFSLEPIPNGSGLHQPDPHAPFSSFSEERLNTMRNADDKKRVKASVQDKQCSRRRKRNLQCRYVILDHFVVNFYGSCKHVTRVTRALPMFAGSCLSPTSPLTERTFLSSLP